MSAFKINALDHVAIRVKDLEATAHWYEKVLGLSKVQPRGWKPFPIFMMRGKFGVALFPAKSNTSNDNSQSIRIDHFAFNVDNSEFEKAKAHFTEIGEKFDFQDHIYFHSIYLTDPDGHTVELTTLVAGDEFYNSH